MRTYEERVNELHLRMNALEHKKTVRNVRLISTAAYSACALIAALLAVMISGVQIQAPGGFGGGAAASIFADHTALGYVVVAILAFCLGTLVTILCHRMKKQMMKKEDGRDD